MARRALCVARRPSPRRLTGSAFRSAAACIPARSKLPRTKCRASPSISPRASQRSPGRARCWCHELSRIWPPGRGSILTSEEDTCSRASKSRWTSTRYRIDAPSHAEGKPQGAHKGEAIYGRRRGALCLRRRLLPPFRQRPQAKGVELDEAGGVVVVVGHGAFLEGDEVLVIKRVRAVAADHINPALVELEPHASGDHLLALVDQRLQELALGGEPEAVVDELSVFRHQLVLEMRGAAVEGDRLDRAARGEQNRAAGRFVHAARLHADEAVLDQVEPADAVVVAIGVQRRQQGRRAHGLAVDGDRIAGVERFRFPHLDRHGPADWSRTLDIPDESRRSKEADLFLDRTTIMFYICSRLPPSESLQAHAD